MSKLENLFSMAFYTLFILKLNRIMLNSTYNASWKVGAIFENADKVTTGLIIKNKN